MYAFFKYDIIYNQQYPEASSTDSLSDEIEESVKLGIIKGYDYVNNNLKTASESDVKYYTVATPSSAESQTVSLIADLRNICIIGFLCLFALIVFYHLKGTIISFLS